MDPIFVSLLILSAIVLAGIILFWVLHKDSENRDSEAYNKLDELARKIDRVERKADGITSYLSKQIMAEFELLGLNTDDIEKKMSNVKIASQDSFKKLGLKMDDIEKETSDAKHAAQSAQNEAYGVLQLLQEVRNQLPESRKRDSKGKFVKKNPATGNAS